eukprot:m.117709 g.117709  ORF g.117709 m.117709 type:complete len:356 (+) comp28598_c0_seq1:358-1425(+)
MATSTPTPHFPAGSMALRQKYTPKAGTSDLTAETLLTPSGLARCKQALKADGFVVVRSLLDQTQVDLACTVISKDVDDWGPPTPHLSGPPPYIDFDPAVTSGKITPSTKELGVRRLFHIATHNSHFRQLCLENERIVAPMKAVLGPNLKLVQSMALLKPPGGGEKRWHQDQGVFRLHSVEHGHSCVMGWWVALDVADADTGCMVFAPRSQQLGIHPHSLPVPAGPTAHIYYGVTTPPNPANTVYVPLQPGDAVLFDVAVVHGTPPNITTDRRRRALQMQYAPADCKPTTCPRDGSVDNVTPTVGNVFATANVPDQSQRKLFFDCELKDCTEPQFWSFRKAEAFVCGEDSTDPDCI